MLQEYPTQIQPRSSSTRETQDAVELQDSSNKVDAEASRILIDLANQDTSLPHFIGTSNHLIGTTKFIKQRTPGKGDIKVSLPIKTDANLHLQQERSPDPIMLLAAAAAVIADEGNRYKKRSYERREIRLHGRHASSTTKRKSFTYGSNDDSDNNNKSSLLHRRHSERRHRYGRPSVSLQDTWTSNQNSTTTGEEEEEEVKGSQAEGTHAFSGQYLSMKQNPRIKRNAMHAYITYMIYTDMAHEQQRVGTRSTPKEQVYSHHGNNTTWYSQQQQGYRLPLSPRQQQQQQTPVNSNSNNGNESIIGRPLTDFLFDGNRNNNSPATLPLPSRMPN